MYDAAEHDSWGTAYHTVVKKANQARSLAPKVASTMKTIVEHTYF